VVGSGISKRLIEKVGFDEPQPVVVDVPQANRLS
jgi:hypothetical protein